MGVKQTNDGWASDGSGKPDSLAYQLGGINNQLTDDFGTDNDMTVTGGGKGWTAKTTYKGLEVAVKGTSKLGAAENLYDHFARVLAAEAEVAKQAQSMTADEVEGDFDDMTEAEAAQCVAECMTSIKPYCECRCGGKNHGAASGHGMVARLGEKLCKCGCGQTTKRLFVPGHDARYHAAQKLAAGAAAANLDPSAYALVLKAQKSEKARLDRKARRDALKAKQAEAAARVKEVVAKS